MTVDPLHDLMHAPDLARPRWRESFYFKFWDFNHQLGGDSTIGYRPARGHSGSLNIIWGRELPTLVASELDHAPDHAVPHPAGGLSYEPVEPFGPWRLRFDGRLNDGGSAVGCDPRAVRAADSSSVPVSYDLLFTPEQPAHIYRENPAWDGLFDGHVDEVGRVTGTLTVDGTTYEIDARGCKDHSWGQRDWARPHGWRWADLLFPEGPEASLWRATFDGDEWLQDGAIYAGGEADPLTSFAERATFAPRDRAPRPQRWSFDLQSARHAITGEAELLRVIPLRFPMRDEHGTAMTAWIDRCLYASTTTDGRHGAGTVEFQSRVPLSGDAPPAPTA
ncbi:hypothetical protein [Conexibacter sp. CPCC 206217]|uniref:DUF7065 domain-containing protein n=1 Tax=Conexibacter sp. CPCC 206217 TaxID=3064574 RepID=UPI00271F99F6|nr:hypothetical protein [Conexibacter sp. CPCC 206217]MDO8212417.1 hypothetical protein [Conexibacter sp. CPCC 206217]